MLRFPYSLSSRMLLALRWNYKGVLYSVQHILLEELTLVFLHVIRIAIIPYYRIRSNHNTNTHETNYKLKLPQILSKREETEDREEHGIALKEVRSKSLCLLSGKETFIRRVGKKLQQCVCVFVAVWVYLSLSLSLFVSVCVCVCVEVFPYQWGMNVSSRMREERNAFVKVDRVSERGRERLWYHLNDALIFVVGLMTAPSITISSCCWGQIEQNLC